MRLRPDPLWTTLVAAGLLAAGLRAEAPAMFRGDAAHAGVFDSAPPTLASVAWTVRTGAKVLGSPVVSGDAVFVGGSDHRLRCLELKSGAERWSFRAGGPIACAPAVAGGRVIFTCLDGQVRALEPATGKVAWAFQTEGERRFSAPGIHGLMPRTEVMPDPFDLFLSSPTVQDGAVFVGSGDGHVYALDLASGALRWKVRTGNVVHASPAVAQGRVFVGSFDGVFYALEAATGKVLWRHQTGLDPDTHNQQGIVSSACVAEGRVFFGCRDGHFYALDAAKGTLLWSHDNRKGWVIASPAVAQGRVYFPTSDGQRFKVLEAATGKTLVDRPMSAVSFSSPALVGNRILVGSSDGLLHLLDRETGGTVATYATEGHRANRAKYLDEKGQMIGKALYPDRTLEGAIIGLDRMFSLGSILSSPVVAEGLVIVGSADGSVLALR
ncbi:MAG: PQQ-binding-like beta-propeller repeat protein [Acidobacteria bacterium]|nr:PQQ-binding-like beta-propeller repeat protein [Acidobacteriota bacterium]